MKSALSTSTFTNSTTTTTTATTEEDDRSEARDSCYYPGCRKDANCNCKYCLDSINATLDLMPYSVQKSSLTKLSQPNVETTPISFNRSILSTPTSSTPQFPSFPNLKSPGKLDFKFKAESRSRNLDFLRRRWMLGLLLVLILIWASVTWFSRSVSMRPLLSADMVRHAGENSLFVQDLNGKLRVLQRELQGMVKGKVSNCSSSNSMWEIDQEGMLLNSRCTLYKSATEAVSLWGWPLQTAGLLSSGFSQRSFTILSGRVTEWSDGGISYLVRKANSSWLQKKWGASAVQLDPQTWVLEYRQSSLLDKSSLNSMALDFFRHWLLKVLRRLKNELWLYSYLETKFNEYMDPHDFKIPT